MKYIIKGDFYDCQLHKGLLYLWDMDGYLSLYNWEEIKHVIGMVPGGDIVYCNIKALQRFRKGLPVEVKGGLFPTDTAFVGRYLYTAMESGLYRGQAIIDAYKKSRYFTSSRPNKVWDCPPLSLTSNQSGLQLAISTGEDGLYEINLSKDVKTQGLKKVEANIFSVSNKKAIRSRYVKNSSIYSTDENLDKYFHEFIISRSNGVLVRTYTKDYDFNSIVKDKWASLSGTTSLSSISRITNTGVEVYPIYRNQQSIRQTPRIEMKGTKKKLLLVEPVSSGIIIEYENGLMLLNRQGKEIVKVNTPVTRWRWLQDSNNKNLLFVILEDHLAIYE